MPHTPSAKKSLRKNRKRRLHNRSVKKGIKEQIKSVLGSVKEGAPTDQQQLELKQAMKQLDKAAAKRVVHPNMAARKKSQLARLINTAGKAKQPAS